MGGELLQQEWPGVEESSCLYSNTYINYRPPYFVPTLPRRRHYCLRGRNRRTRTDGRRDGKIESGSGGKRSELRSTKRSFSSGKWAHSSLLCFGWLAVPRCLSLSARSAGPSHFCIGVSKHSPRERKTPVIGYETSRLVFNDSNSICIILKAGAGDLRQ